MLQARELHQAVATKAARVVVWAWAAVGWEELDSVVQGAASATAAAMAAAMAGSVLEAQGWVVVEKDWAAGAGRVVAGWAAAEAAAAMGEVAAGLAAAWATVTVEAAVELVLVGSD